MLSMTHHAQNYAGTIGRSLVLDVVEVSDLKELSDQDMH